MHCIGEKELKLLCSNHFVTRDVMVHEQLVKYYCKMLTSNNHLKPLQAWCASCNFFYCDPLAWLAVPKQ